MGMSQFAWLLRLYSQMATPELPNLGGSQLPERDRSGPMGQSEYVFSGSFEYPEREVIQENTFMESAMKNVKSCLQLSAPPHPTFLVNVQYVMQ